MKSNLDIIFDTCKEIMRIDLSLITRRRHYVEYRSIYYKVCKELIPDQALEKIGEKTNTDHATVIHGLKMFNIYSKDMPTYEMFLICRKKCMSRLGIKEVLIKDQGDLFVRTIKKQEILIASLEKQILQLEEKLSKREKRNPPLITQIRTLSPEQYAIFEQRSEVILKAIKSYRTHENTAKKEFNVRVNN